MKKFLISLLVGVILFSAIPSYAFLWQMPQNSKAEVVEFILKTIKKGENILVYYSDLEDKYKLEIYIYKSKIGNDTNLKKF